ncbi:hypothetical protein N7468_000244 [Penicillium chermesinum]|uniref:Uncharacterized protein n=1 Tax=Penicillium chermesinum TaxID=63820 RepID=A0A9W9TY61_9EURO|nr:uncharacterized protein N7468_000244 [Penicillium chermesinum]KAJ5248793.1 hypothetical protein N7468_000244 [Penicillium chermesinum]
MDQDEAPPPPYSAVDPLLAPGDRHSSSQQSSTPSRESPASSQHTRHSHVVPLPTPAPPTVVPTHFTSAVSYFEERPASAPEGTRETLHHHMTIYPRSQSKDFPRRPRCWAPRLNDVTQQDWDTFLRYLFPPELGPAAASQDLPRQLRAEIQRDRKDRPQESDEQRYARIVAVIDEWNENFFEPRATRLDFVYIGEPDTAPKSALCPYCYPAATKATNSSTTSSPVPGRTSSNPSNPSPVPGQPLPHHWQMGYGQPYANSPPMPPGMPAPASPFPSQAYQAPQYYPGRPPPPGFAPPAWQWNNPACAQAQTNSGSKGGLSGWISNLSAQAQKYGERFAEQAQQYGDQISAQAMYYGRQVEERALLHGRWIEEQAGIHPRKPGTYPPHPPPAGYYPYQWGPPPPGAVPVAPPVVPSPSPLRPAEIQPVTSTPNTPVKPEQPDQQGKKSIEHSRRASVSSVSSESSFSSLESLETTSDLSASDLANIRTQLQSLEDRHGRTLYEAAADLRRQLDVLQDSRREAKTSGRINRQHGWNRPQVQPVDRNDWGRWDSPAQQQRQSMERRAMKDEMRATRKAFREVVRRAREEQRDKRRNHKHRYRQSQGLHSADENETGESLAGNLNQLSLSGQPNLQTSESRPIAQSQFPAPSQMPHGPQNAVPGSSNTPSVSSLQSHNTSAVELPDRKAKTGGKTRLRDKLMPRSSKQHNASAESEDAKAKAKREADETKARLKEADDKAARKKDKDPSGS